MTFRCRESVPACFSPPGALRAPTSPHGGEASEADVIRARAGLLEGKVEEARQALEVVARGEFRDDAAEVLVQVHLRVDDVRHDAAAVLDQRDGGFVTRCFDAER